MYQHRTYRNLISKEDRPFFRVAVKETDLFVHAADHLESLTRELIITHRGYLESYIKMYPDFATSLAPWRISGPTPAIIRDMANAGEHAGVGPMAAVAGAIAEHVGTGLLEHTPEVIVENGGDIFFKIDTPLTMAIFAGKSPLSLKIGLRMDSGDSSLAVCTSSGTVGHSLSLGKADAVCVVSQSCSLADAAATSIGNRVRTSKDIQDAIAFGKTVSDLIGLVIIIGDKIGAWGDLEIVPIPRKKG